MATLQSLRGYSRTDLINGDIYELLFRHTKTQQACRIFLEWLKENNQQATPREVSSFANDLYTGKIVEGFTYRRESFYRIILKRLLTLGFISKQSRYPKQIVYAPVIQPIPKRAPILTTWWGFAYLVAEKWNAIWN